MASKKYLDSSGLTYLWSKIKSLIPTKTSELTNDSEYITIDHSHTMAECKDSISSVTYTGVLRNNVTYSSPYTNSYLYFGQVIPTDLSKPSSITYRVLAYGTDNDSYMLDSIVTWYFSTDGIYKAYWIWNNLNSTSYYPFGYHSLYRSNSSSISASDGSYFGCYYGTSKSYGQNPNTVERTIVVDILECENCTATLNSNIVWFHDTDNMPANLVQTSTSVAYNTSNFTVVNVTTNSGLQETGDGNTNYYDRMVYGYIVTTAGAASGRYSIGFLGSDNKFYGIAQTSATGTTKTLNTSVEIDPSVCLYQTTATYSAGSDIAANALYSRYNLVDIRYSCNQGSWMTAKQPVYIILNLSESGYFTVNSTVFTHTLPTTNDGLYYKFVGMAYDTYRIVFEPKETIYYHDGTKLCVYDSGSKVSITQTLTSGTEIGSITIDGTDTTLYAPTVPTKTSDLTNDSGYITNAGVTSFNGATGAVTYTAPVTSVNGNTGAVTIDIPTKTSDITNDSGYITSSDIPENIFLTTVTSSTTDGTTTYSADRTYDEIVAAYSNDKICVLKEDGYSNLYWMDDPVFNQYTNTSTATFVSIYTSYGIAICVITIDDSNNITRGDSFIYDSTDVLGSICQNLKSVITNNNVETSVSGTFTYAHSAGDIVFINLEGRSPRARLYKILADVSAGDEITSDVWEKVTIDTLLSDKANAADIPTAVSQLTNDSGYITSSDIPQSDWSENNSTSSAYIANRTHYTGDAVMTEVWNQTITMGGTYTEESLNDYSWTENLEDGLAYSLVYNGTTYTGNVYYDDENNQYVLGNKGMYDSSLEDTGEPFELVIDSYYLYLTLAESYTGDITFELTISIAPVYKLDSKYLEGKLITEGTGVGSEIFNNMTNNAASGNYSHAEGFSTTASGHSSHAEGDHTTASGYISHAEGNYTTASESSSHAEGDHTTASGLSSHAEGSDTTASGYISHAEGSNTKASSANQHVQGKYNIEDSNSTYADIVGNGTSNTARSNAYTLDWSGNGVYAGKVTVGTAPTADMDVATKGYVDNSIVDNVFIVTYNYDDSNGWSFDKTYDEVYNAYSSEKVVVLTPSKSRTGSNSIYYLAYFLDDGIFYFYNIDNESEFLLDSEDNVTYVQESLKVLQVDITYDSSEDTYNSVRSFNTIYDCLSNGGIAYVVYDNDVYTLLDYHNTYANFGCYTLSSAHYIWKQFNIFIEDETTYVSYTSGIETVPTAAVLTPHMDGTAAVGVNGTYARADHVHPSDTTKANISDVLTKTNTTSYTPSADYHPATKKYVDDSISGFSSSLSGLTDTTISSPTNGQVLSYDTSTSKWKNTTISTNTTYTLSMTNNVITLTGSDGSTSSITLPVYDGGVS